ncbi:MAG: FAD-binding oxidoreductase [Actinomycetota bacterium]|nr:FAD-binding oxidoreductase [Actinomycetota bacterium]
MGPSAGESEPALPPDEVKTVGGDIDIVPPRGALARGAPERRLMRADRYDRLAQLIGHEELTPTGTVLMSFRVVDDKPFRFEPGHFVGIRAEVGGHGVRRSPYCIASPPNEERTFRLLVRLVPEGPLSYYLAGLGLGDVIRFRGPSGRSMVPKEADTEVVLVATGVGVGPCLPLVRHLRAQNPERPIRLYWGLRLVDDICLLDELDELTTEHRSFRYAISLSQPPAGWTGLRGRVTESVPGLLQTLGDKSFCLIGNGAMTQEMATALSDFGVDERRIHQEVYFNVKHRPEAAVLDEIRDRFVASDLFSPYAHQKAGLFMPETPVTASRRARRS